MLLKVKSYTLTTSSMFLGLLLSLVANSVLALELGELTLNSALNEPLDATVEVLDIDGLDEAQIIFEMAGQADFDQADVERISLLNQIEFDVETVSSDSAIVHLTTTDNIVEPYLVFILNSRWPTGQLMREYTVLMDLPIFNETAAPDVQLASQAQDSIQDLDQQIQTAEVPAEVVEAELIVETTVDTDTQTGTILNSATTASNSTLLVEANDTLWEIALQSRENNSVSVQQMMLAIQRANPEAFINNNINLLREGQELIIPTMQEILALGQQQAVAQVAIQNQQFGIAQPLAVNTNVDTDASSADLNDELRVLTNDGGLGTDDLSSLQNQLAISEESLDTARIENEELNSRLGDMEAEISLLQNIIDVEDQRLAVLQQDLIEETGNVDEEVDVAAIVAAPDASAALEDDSEQSAAEIIPAQVISSPGFFGRISDLFQNTAVLIGSVVAFIVLALGFLLWKGRDVEDSEESFLVQQDEFDDEDEFELETTEDETLEIDGVDAVEIDESEIGEIEVVELDELDIDESELDESELDETELDETELDETDVAEKGELDLDEIEDDELALEINEVDGTDYPQNGDFVLDVDLEDADELDIEIAELELETEEAEVSTENEAQEKLEISELDALDLEETLDTHEELEDLELDESEVASLDLDTDLDEEDDELDELAELELDESEDTSLDDEIDLDGILEEEDETLDSDEIAGLDLDESDIPVLEDEAQLDEDSLEDEPVLSVLESSDNNGLEIDFVATDEEDISEPEISSSAPDMSEDNLIEFPLKADVPKLSEVPVEDTSEEVITPIFDSQDEDFEFLLDEDDNDADDSVDNIAGATDDDDMPSVISFDDVDETKVQNNSDEQQDQYSTKLDLAVAYEAMGDLDGARTILQEVVAAGNDAQVGEAKRLLDKRMES